MITSILSNDSASGNTAVAIPPPESPLAWFRIALIDPRLKALELEAFEAAPANGGLRASFRDFKKRLVPLVGKRAENTVLADPAIQLLARRRIFRALKSSRTNGGQP